MRPTVTVVIPAYNAEATVETAIRSALAQTYRDLEVLVVDDGSTDGTAATVRAIQDDRLRLIQQPNLGVAAARNRAIRDARGVFLAPLDADDIWYPEKLAHQVQRIEAGGPTMGMVYSWWVGVDETGDIRGSTFPCCAEGDLALCLLYVNFLGNASVPLYRLAAIERVGGYEPAFRTQGAQGCEDWDLSLRVASCYETGVVSRYHVGYRQAEGTMSADTATMARSYEAVIERFRAQRHDVPKGAYRWSRANFAGYLAAQSYRMGQCRDAIRWMMHALWTDPLYALAPYTYRLLGRALVGHVKTTYLNRAIVHPLPPRYTLDEVNAQWAGTRWQMPWARSNSPFARVRTRRWERLRQRSQRSEAPIEPSLLRHDDGVLS